MAYCKFKSTRRKFEYVKPSIRLQLADGRFVQPNEIAVTIDGKVHILSEEIFDLCFSEFVDKQEDEDSEEE